MNKYIKPEIDFVEFEVNDVITASGEGNEKLSTWGSAVKIVNSTEIVDIFE